MNYDEILNELIKIGMPLSLKGTKYVAQCMIEMNTYYDSFTELYGKIAKINNTTIYAVERNIRTAFSKCRDNPTDYFIVDKYLGYSRTSNAETLLHLYVKIKKYY